ncbi:MAG TPA: molybdopterin-binding protein [Pseudolabrys sp.]|jgi:molybdopterin biosynthesis enzyme|nr:molybdopterin-binding protein [Pseudolabrys sp.]
MAAARETRQTISRFTPLAELTALMDREVKPTVPHALELAAAGGAILAGDVAAPARPNAAIALIDGWALSAEATRDAGGYAPALLADVPQRVDVGDVMPPGADCVAPLDIVKMADGRAKVLAAVGPGDGVLPAGGDSNPSEPLRRAGERLRGIDVAVCAAAGVSHLTVRQPRLHVAALRRTDIVAAAARAIAADIERFGGIVRHEDGTNDFATLLNDADAFITLGGTGTGHKDAAVTDLHEKGRVAVHGVALTPGETMAFGFIGDRPVLLLPGRLDAALAVWLIAGRHLLGRLAGADLELRQPTERLPLARKVVSTVGLAELIPVRRVGNEVEPLASKYLPFSALTRSDGWILVPAASEGYSAGTLVSVSPWP